MIDLNRFKKINDSHGHQIGDSVLRETAEILSGLVRDGDFVGRYGGEEFALIISCTEKDELLLLGQRLRTAVEQHRYTYPEGELSAAISLGGKVTGPAN